jgi:tetratricopeptide (TPR) repeat protein
MHLDLALSPFGEQLLRATPAARRQLIRRRAGSIGEGDVDALADHARRAADVDPRESLRIAGIAGELAEALNHPRARALACRAEAVALWAHGRLEEALTSFEEGVAAAREAGDPLLAAQIPIAALFALAQLGRYDEALRAAARIEAELRSLGADEDAAKVVANAGIIYGEREAYPEALACFERALAYFSAQDQSAPVARLQMNIANVLTQLNRLPEALERYSAAWTTFEAAGMDLSVAGLLGNMGYLEFTGGRYTQALHAYGEARSRFERLQQPRDLAQCDRETADVYLELNLIPEAIETYERVLPAFRDLQAPAEAARCELALSEGLFAQGREEAALAALARAEDAFHQAGNEIGLARVRLQRAQRWRAADGGRQTADDGRQTEDPVGPAPSAVHRPPSAIAPSAAAARRNAQAALRSFRRHGVRVGEMEARLLLAEIEQETAPPEAPGPRRALGRLVRDAEAGAFVSLLWRAEATLARSYARAGKESAAVRHYRRAVAAAERVRRLLRGDDFRISFLRDKLRLYEELMTLLIERGTSVALREAFRVAEQAKSRTLLELLAGPLEQEAGSDRTALLRRLEALRTQLNWEYARLHRLDDGARRLPAADPGLPTRVAAIEKEYVQVQRQLQLGMAGWQDDRRRTEDGGRRTADDGRQTADGRRWTADSRRQTMDGRREAAPVLRCAPSIVDRPSSAVLRPPSVVLPRVQDLQALLAPGEQLVEYAIAQDEILAFVIDRQRFRTVRGLATRAQVELLARQLRFQWNRLGLQRDPGIYGPQIATTTTDLLGRLYDALVGPLESLLTGERVTVIPHGVLHGIPFHALHDGRQHALERWQFAYAPSAAIWRACRRRERAPAGGALVFGVSDPNLAHVREEIAGLRRCLPGACIYEDQSATLASVPRAGAYRYLHFATHAVFRHDNPLFSGLRMADGWLIAHDLYRRRLECELATLSACRTGMAAVAPGDEVIGMARGFLQAGARSVMVSLWAAHDAATATLMQECYSRLVAGASRAAALRAAQQAVREQLPHPYYWAPFILLGDC